MASLRILVLFGTVLSAAAVAAGRTAFRGAVGLTESKIIGGAAGRMGNAAYMVQIEVQQEGTFFYSCAAFVLDAMHVVTAANCVGDSSSRKPFDSATIRVRAGSAASEKGGVVVGVARVQLHPKWTTSTPTASIQFGDCDVAVLTLQRALALGGTVQKATLAPAGQPPAAETLVRVSSWGVAQRTDSTPSAALKTLTAPVIPQPACDQLYRKRGARVAAHNFCIQSATNKALCAGDSGAAVARFSDGVVLGIFSWGSCGVDGNPAVIADLTNREVRSFMDGALKK